MRTKKTLTVAGLGLFVMLAGRQATLPAQQRVPALTALDQIEIQQLVAQANYALHTGQDDGNMYAGLFTADGVFHKAVGREQLAALARGGRKRIRSLVTNVIVEPSADGAIGKHYAWRSTGRSAAGCPAPPTLRRTLFAKTSEGWRSRSGPHHVHSTSEASKAIASDPRPNQQPAAAAPPSVPLELLKKRQGRDDAHTGGLPGDSEARGQLLSADSGIGRTTTARPRGILLPPTASSGAHTTGHDALVKLASHSAARSTLYPHFLTNIVIEPSPEGARGRQYLVVIDIGEGGKPSSVLIGGHYEDIYVKTPEGWRFKSRTLYQARTGNAQ